MTLPAHTQRELITAGDLTTNHVTPTPQTRRCPTCRAWCLVAIPYLLHGATWVDHTPTTTYGELVALTHGHRTWTATRRALEHRSVETIRTTPADEARDVHVTHSCGTTWPTHPNPKYRHQPKNTRRTYPTECPY